MIHRIWLGSDPMPEEFVEYGETWRRHHPEWRMELWTDERLPELVNGAVLERSRNQSERSNVIRYELLGAQGGLYVDTDVECLRPIDDLVDGHDAFAATTVPGRVGSAVIGSVPGHPAMARAVELVGERVGVGKQTNATGPGFLTEVLTEFPDVTIFGSETFYPYTYKERHRRGEEFPAAYAVHHWARTWEEGADDLARRVERLEAKVARMRAQRDEARRGQADARARLTALEAGDARRTRRPVTRVRAALARVSGAVRRRPGVAPRTRT